MTEKNFWGYATYKNMKVGDGSVQFQALQNLFHDIQDNIDENQLMEKYSNLENLTNTIQDIKLYLGIIRAQAKLSVEDELKEVLKNNALKQNTLTEEEIETLKKSQNAIITYLKCKIDDGVISNIHISLLEDFFTKEIGKVKIKYFDVSQRNVKGILMQMSLLKEKDMTIIKTYGDIGSYILDELKTYLEI